MRADLWLAGPEELVQRMRDRERLLMYVRDVS